MRKLGPAEFFLSLKEPTKEKSASLAKMVVKTQAKDTVKAQLRQAGVSTAKLSPANSKIVVRPPKAKAAKVPKVKKAAAEALVRGMARAVQKGYRKAPDVLEKARLGMGDARAYGEGFMAKADPGMWTRFKGWATGKPVVVPSKEAKGKGARYYKKWRAGKSTADSIGVHETADTLKRQLQNSAGGYDPDSVLRGLRRTGILTEDSLAKAGLGGQKILNEAAKKRSLMQSRNARLAAGGVGIGAAGIGTGMYLTRDKGGKDEQTA